MQADTKAAAETRARKGCGFVHRLARPLWRACCDGRYSSCASRDLHELDWLNWWQDGNYIHVRAYTWDEGETWHRVFPRAAKGRPRLRLAVRDGRPFWIFDKPNKN